MKHEELTKLQKQYDKLPIEEKLARMEYLAQYYLSTMTKDASVIVDATKHWPQFAEMKRQDEGVEAGTVTLGDVFRG